MQKKFQKLDYTLSSPEERIQYVKHLLNTLAETEEMVSRLQLEYFANYILDALPKEEKQKANILTDTRLSYIKRYRETSYEGLALTLERGEDGIPSLATTNPHQYLTQRKKITEEDLKSNKYLQNITDEVKKLEKQLEIATGHDAYIIKKTIIELNQMKYTIKALSSQPIGAAKNRGMTYSKGVSLPLEKIQVDKNGDEFKVIEGISLAAPEHVAAIFNLYGELKAENSSNILSDVHYLMEEFDEIFEHDYKEKYPEHYRIAKLKIQGKTNADIHRIMREEFNSTHTVEYISSLWTTKIPKEFSDIAIDKYIYWYYTTQKPGVFKRCSKCGQIKLMNNRYFSKNITAKDGYYSQCKACRNSKQKERRNV